MIRFKATGKDGRTLIGLGITKANVARMEQGEPIKVSTDEYGLSAEKIDFCIFYGKDLETLQKQLSPFIGSDTKIHRDPLLDQMPEDARKVKEGQNLGKI